jgi:thiamine pyrophosphate-dependent acetolactate synthase large subunit-like protein
MRDVLHRPSRRVAAADAKIVRLGTSGDVIRSNYQDFQRYVGADLDISADAEASLPALIGHLQRLIDKPLGSRLAARRQTLEAKYRARRKSDLEAAALSWDLSPVSPARTAMEVWEQVKSEDWALVGMMTHPAAWAQRLWPMDKYYHHTGATGAAGVGYGLPAAVGGALAHREKGRLPINFQPDGDFMFVPGALWTAAHHKIPLLTVMFNNRAYHQETMHLQRMANRMDRDVRNAHIGTTLTAPNIDYAKMAQSMGVFGVGPISDPAQLRDAIRRALQVVKRGEPALIDVVSQPR